MIIIVIKKFLKAFGFSKRAGRKNPKGEKAARFPKMFTRNTLTLPEKRPDIKAITVLNGTKFTRVSKYALNASILHFGMFEAPILPK
jgi:hypothetical protein